MVNGWGRSWTPGHTGGATNTILVFWGNDQNEFLVILFLSIATPKETSS